MYRQTRHTCQSNTYMILLPELDVMSAPGNLHLENILTRPLFHYDVHGFFPSPKSIRFLNCMNLRNSIFFQRQAETGENMCHGPGKAFKTFT